MDILNNVHCGCAAKLPSGLLKQALASIPCFDDANLLAGFNTMDDAAVYKISNELALIHTLDFFPPITGDPYTYGKIAAANALSDIYAMGGEVKTALNILCFPEKGGLETLGKILQGGAEKVNESGGILCGGHSIYDKGIKYGLSATGTAHPNKIYHNNRGGEGDVLILTKPLGTGIVMAAYTLFKKEDEAYSAAVSSMEFLNKYAAEIIRDFPVSACTDVSGYGLLGHMHEMLPEGKSILLKAGSIPLLPRAYEYAKEFILTAGGQKNRKSLSGKINSIISDEALMEILYDPQTSGGLLLALPEKEGNAVVDELQRKNIPAAVIAKISSYQNADIIIN